MILQNRNRIGILLGYYSTFTFLCFAFFYYLTVGSTVLLINNSVTSLLVLAITFLVQQDYSWIVALFLLFIHKMLDSMISLYQMKILNKNV